MQGEATLYSDFNAIAVDVTEAGDGLCVALPDPFVMHPKHQHFFNVMIVYGLDSIFRQRLPENSSKVFARTAAKMRISCKKRNEYIIDACKRYGVRIAEVNALRRGQRVKLHILEVLKDCELVVNGQSFVKPLLRFAEDGLGDGVELVFKSRKHE